MSTHLPSSLSIGNIIGYNNGRYRILKMEHVKPGKGGAFYQIEMKEVQTGTKLNERIRSEDKLKKLETSSTEFIFLFRAGDVVTIMDAETFEQIEVNASLFDGLEGFLEDEMKLMGDYIGDEILSIRLPHKVKGVIAQTDHVIKNAAATQPPKDAKLENGFSLKVPYHLTNGDEIWVNSETLEFVEKVKPSK